MPQVTLYLDAETREKLKTAAQAAGVSQSKWVSALVRQKTESEWPVHVAELAGAWNDFPDAERLRPKSARDVRRERL